MGERERSINLMNYGIVWLVNEEKDTWILLLEKSSSTNDRSRSLSPAWCSPIPNRSVCLKLLSVICERTISRDASGILRNCLGLSSDAASCCWNYQTKLLIKGINHLSATRCVPHLDEIKCSKSCLTAWGDKNKNRFCRWMGTYGSIGRFVHAIHPRTVKLARITLFVETYLNNHLRNQVKHYKDPNFQSQSMLEIRIS